jgi:hypothetical protein
MITLTPAHVENLSEYLFESFKLSPDEIDLDTLQPEHIATMINMYIAGDMAADKEWIEKL